MKIVAIYGSPRKGGNTDTLLKKAVEGAILAGAQVDEFFLREMKISPCLEIYACKEDGRCAIKDDFQKIFNAISDSKGIIVASPVFFYGVSAQLKAFIDRCQSRWVKKYVIDGVPFGKERFNRLGLLISVGASHGKRLFDGVLLTVRYFMDAIDTKLWKSLLYRGLEDKDDVLKHEEYLVEALNAGQQLVSAIERTKFVF